MPGLSIANNLLANQAQFNLNRNEESLKSAAAHLSSGMRINSASDDPSGLAISTNLQTAVDAFTRASQNVQDANNAAQVADGALASETDILQRIRSLAVEASSSINSASDNQNLQSEISQLLLEVNRISQNTNFNGQALLDGSRSGFAPYVDASYTITSNAALASAANAGGGSLGAGVTNGTMMAPLEANNSFNPFVAPTGWTMTGNYALYNGAPVASQVALPAGQQAVDVTAGATMSQTLTGLTPGAAYQLNYQAGSPVGGTLQVNAQGTITNPAIGTGWQSYSTTFTANASGQATITFSGLTKHVDVTDVSISNGTGLVAAVSEVSSGGGTIFNTTTNGAVDGTVELQVINTSSTSVGVQVSFFSSASGAAGTQMIYAAQANANTVVTVDGLDVVIGNVTAADAGAMAFIKVSQAVAAGSSASGPLTIQSGADEGNTVQIGIQATNAQTLRISNINVANTFAPVLAAEDAVGQIDIALHTLLSQRAQLGAVIVRLHEDATSDNVAAVNLQASESAIRDVNVDQATTEFTKLQVLVQVGTSVLAQSNSNAQSVLGLFR